VNIKELRAIIANQVKQATPSVAGDLISVEQVLEDAHVAVRGSSTLIGASGQVHNGAYNLVQSEHNLKVMFNRTTSLDVKKSTHRLLALINDLMQTSDSLQSLSDQAEAQAKQIVILTRGIQRELEKEAGKNR